MSTISKCALFSYMSVFVFITITRIPGLFRISVYALNLQNVIYCQSSICCFNQISLIDGSRQWNSETLEFPIYLIELHSSWFAAGAGRFEQKAALVSLVLFILYVLPPSLSSSSLWDWRSLDIGILFVCVFVRANNSKKMKNKVTGIYNGIFHAFLKFISKCSLHSNAFNFIDSEKCLPLYANGWQTKAKNKKIMSLSIITTKEHVHPSPVLFFLSFFLR